MPINLYIPGGVYDSVYFQNLRSRGLSSSVFQSLEFRLLNL
jgi:hypothetical protein